MDKHFWKDAYKDSWTQASKKEAFIKSILEKETGEEVIEVGLGAGTNQYIKGNALDNQLTKGDADLYIPARDAFIEVTGPNIPMALGTIWIRPDKINNTKSKLEKGMGRSHSVFHVLDEKGTGNKIIRVILLNDEFYNHYEKGEFPIVTPTIRGRTERYVELPAKHRCIITLDEYIELIK